MEQCLSWTRAPSSSPLWGSTLPPMLQSGGETPSKILLGTVLYQRGRRRRTGELDSRYIVLWTALWVAGMMLHGHQGGWLTSPSLFLPVCSWKACTLQRQTPQPASSAYGKPWGEPPDLLYQWKSPWVHLRTALGTPWVASKAPNLYPRSHLRGFVGLCAVPRSNDTVPRSLLVTLPSLLGCILDLLSTRPSLPEGLASSP